MNNEIPDSKNHNPDPIYLKGLIKKSGFKQYEVAAILGIEQRNFRRFLAKKTAKSACDCPYTVQFCLEVLSKK